MRAGRTSKIDLGETASIALSIHDSSLVFVTVDRAGAFHALNELGPGRVLTAHWFLRRLADAKALPVGDVRDVAAHLESASSGGAPQPGWWRDWFAAVPPA
ncbi:MAG TPA: hypothetical protein VH877_10080 [Polyangia bacterium]|nr:hypothetical protein [Polyangia bacterium]